jgi:hypothetical protein
MTLAAKSLSNLDLKFIISLEYYQFLLIYEVAQANALLPHHPNESINNLKLNFIILFSSLYSMLYNELILLLKDLEKYLNK